MDVHWIGTWSTAQQLTEVSNLPKEPGLSGSTLRQKMRVSLGGKTLRLRLSNQYGVEALSILSVQCAVAAADDTIEPGTSRGLTFSGASSVTLTAQQTVTSDPLDFDLHPLSILAVTIAFGQTPRDVTGHPASRTTSYLQLGECASAVRLPGAVPVEHWYILSAIEVLAPSEARTVVFLGDSIVDGRGSTTNGFDRFPDQLASRLQSNPATAHVGVLNHGIGGNAVVFGGLGPTALLRLDRDVLTQSKARWVILLEGVNDIGNARSETVAELIEAYQQVTKRAHHAGLRVIGSPILPFRGSGYYSPEQESQRQAVNAWIRDSGQFDAVVDLDAAVRDPEQPDTLLRKYDCGDHLHLNPVGYRALADAVDLALFAT